jgi:hypothetical protein
MPSPRLDNHFKPCHRRPRPRSEIPLARPFVLVSVHAAPQATDALAMAVDGQTRHTVYCA